VYQDQTLRCRDCGQDFVFTAGEQEFYASRGLNNAPSRCPECRSARKRASGGGGGGGYSDRGSSRGERQMYDAVCADCGRATQVPFLPRNDRPVYCSDCYSHHSSNRSQRY
jgi:CxxC-x17-CxxC domain-containing protein